MGRTLNLTEVRSQLPALVKAVADGDDQIVITTRNEPKAMIVGYQAFQRQRRLRLLGAHALIKVLVEQAQILIESTHESSRGAGEPDLYLFLVRFEQIMHDIWETAEEISSGHAAVASQLLDVSRIYLAGEAQLQPEQLPALAASVTLLGREQLTMAEAAAADRALLAQGLNAFFPVPGELVALYETQEVAQP